MKLQRGLRFFETHKPFLTHYRAVLPNGSMWCEGKNVNEIVGLSKHIEGISYIKIKAYQVTEGWEDWKPSKKILNAPRTNDYAELAQEMEDDKDDV